MCVCVCVRVCVCEEPACFALGKRERGLGAGCVASVPPSLHDEAKQQPSPLTHSDAYDATDPAPFLAGAALASSPASWGAVAADVDGFLTRVYR